ncbi:MAG: HAD family hydrolase [Actinomycetota bacterium]
METVKLVILDIGNVILKFDHRITCSKLSAYSDYSEDKIYSMVFEDNLFFLYEQGKISSKDYFNKVRDRLGLNIRYEQFYPIWGDIFSIIEEMEEVIFSLERKAKLYALSNTDELHFLYLKNKFSIFEHFNQSILSYEVGACKPDKKIYRKALETAGLPASEALFVDDIAENAEAFRKMGGKAVVFRGVDDLKGHFKKYNLL